MFITFWGANIGTAAAAVAAVGLTYQNI